MMKDRFFSSEIRNRIIAAVIAVILIIVGFVIYYNSTHNRIIEQNTRYLQGTTLQTSRRIDDLLNNAQMMINVTASSYESTMTSDSLDPATLSNMLRETPFNDLIYISADGTAYDDRGTLESFQDVDEFDPGFSGKTGIALVEDPQIEKDGLMAFYAPVHYQDRIVGVLAGAYTKTSITEMITTYFFDEQTSTFIVDNNGDIVVESTTRSTSYENIFDYFSDSKIEGVTTDELRSDLANNINTGFTFTNSNGMGTAYLMNINDTDWMLLRSFSPKVTNSMVTRATTESIILILIVIAAIVLFLAVLLFQNRREKSKLLLEKQQADRVVDASTNLFQRLIRFNLADDTYEYLKASGMNDKMPAKGNLEALINECLESAYSKEDAEIIYQTMNPGMIKETLMPGVPYIQSEYRTKAEREDGLPIWIQVSVLSLQRDENGIVESVLVTIQDVTDIKQHELEARDALEAACQAADQASKAKSDFLNSMSHDIRTPMNSIMGLTAIASMNIGDEERVKDCLEKITISSRHLLGLINEVLDMAKIESGEISLVEEEFDLSETVESLLTIINPQVNAKHQELKIDIQSIEHENVVGDPMRLQQVFLNIMGNSIKFTPEGGQIGMSIKEMPSQTHGYGCYEFTFTDTGVGMSPEFLETIFEPFSRANDSRTSKIEGTGLGMSIVRNIVSMMNGTIEVESQVDVGTTFKIVVYLKLRDVDEEDLTELADLPILVADDDINACDSTVAILNDMGMKAEYVQSGQEAVEAISKAKDGGNEYVAVILDWMMPGMSGVETAKEIRRNISDSIPIIILSAYDLSSIEDEALKTGVDALISKPLFRSRLVRVMKEVLTGSKSDGFDEQEALNSCDYSVNRILLTEDNDLAASIAEEIIGMTGAAVDRANNGKEAVEMLGSQGPGTYDLVFMDIQMPVMNGYEATKAIRGMASERPDLGEIPIVALTSDAFNEDIQKAKAAGMNGHMSKPMEIATLLKTMEQWLDR